MGEHVPVPPEEDPLVPPPVQVQEDAFHVPPEFRQLFCAVVLQAPPEDDDELTPPVVPEVPEVPEVPDVPEVPPVELLLVPAAHRQVLEFQVPPAFWHATRSESLQTLLCWQRPFCVQLPPEGQSPADMHSTQRPTPLGGALHMPVGAVHWLAVLQKPGASGPQVSVVVLQNWSSGHCAEVEQEVPPVPRATQRLVATSHCSVIWHWSSVWHVEEAPEVPLEAPPRAKHSPSTQMRPAGQSASVEQPDAEDPLQPVPDDNIATPTKPIEPSHIAMPRTIACSCRRLHACRRGCDLV